LILEAVSVMHTAGVFFVMDKYWKHVKAQWHLYLIILFLLTLLGFERSGKGTRQASSFAANTEHAATLSPAGEGKTGEDSALSQVPDQVGKGEVPKESLSPAVAVDAPVQCIGGCPGSCAGSKPRAPFRATQWRFAPDVGLYYLPVQSGWLISATAPGNKANVVYVPRSSWSKLLRGLRRGGGCGAGFEKGKFLNRPFRSGGVCDSRAPRVTPQPPVPSVESLLGIGQNSDGGATPGNGLEKQSGKNIHERHVPELPKPSGVPSGGSSGGETGSDNRDGLRLPGGVCAGSGDEGRAEVGAADVEDDDLALPDNIAGLPETGAPCGEQSLPVSEAGVADTAGVCR
jgi:hypothetical protein